MRMMRNAVGPTFLSLLRGWDDEADAKRVAHTMREAMPVVHC